MLLIGSATVIEEILLEHVETLQFLWARRLSELAHPEVSLRALQDLEERILAHADAVVLTGGDALPLLQEGLGGDELEASLAAGHCLLALGLEQTELLVLEALKTAQGPCLDGVALSLCYGRWDGLVREVEALALSGPQVQASAAAQVLAFHGRADVAMCRIEEFLGCAEAQVRRNGWRTLALAGAVAGPHQARVPRSFDAFAPGLCDDDTVTVHLALQAAAWTRQQWLLEFYRSVAKDPTPESLEVLQTFALLGEPCDLALVQRIGRAAALGCARFRVLSSYGHPELVPILLEALRDPDPTVAVEAGSAYSRMTGVDIGSGEKVKLGDATPPADEFEAEFLDEAFLPSPEKAHEHWNRVADNFKRGCRWRRGVDLETLTPFNLPPWLDGRTRLELHLRCHFTGLSETSLAQCERFPVMLTR